MTKKAKDDKKPVGRPSKCTPEVTEEICAWLAGGQSLREFCETHTGEKYPDMSTITRWIVRDDEFRKQYAHAREAGGFAAADAILTLSNRASDGLVDANQARIAMDGYKWSAERMAPKSHLVRTEMDLISSDGSMSAPTEIVLRGVAAVKDDDAG
jgi:hypothetical protein